MKSSYRLKKGKRPSGRGQPGGRFDGTFVADYEFVEGHGEPTMEETWLVGHDAIDRILATQPSPGRPAGEIQTAKRTICLDFDGVIHSYRSGWCGADVIPDPPVHGTQAAIERLRKTFRVVIHSARCRTEEGRAAIESWLKQHGVKVDEVAEHKPPAIAYVDDRAIPFTGKWDDVAISIHDFRLTFPLESRA